MNRRSIRICLTIALVLLAPVLFVAREASAAAPKKLLIAVTQEPTTIDPSLAWVGPDYALAFNLGEYLIYRAPNGELKPGLAHFLESLARRKGDRLHPAKGRQVPQRDPLRQRCGLQLRAGERKKPSPQNRLKSMDRVEVIDDYRFKIHSSTPDVTFIPNRGAAMIVSKAYYDRVGEEKFVREARGDRVLTRFVRYVPGEYVDMERFEDYWGREAFGKGGARFFLSRRRRRRVAKLKAGEVDFIRTSPIRLCKTWRKARG